MARYRKYLAEAKSPQCILEEEQRTLLFIDLVEKIRRSNNKQITDDAFEKILTMMNSRIEQISYKFRIPGLSFHDVYQEALYALRFKAIKDYDQDRSKIEKISPFDRFAMLCIRRHLSTKLKSSYQNKSKVLNSSISLDQDRNTSNQDTNGTLFLSDILPKTEKDVASEIKDKEYYSVLVSHLFRKLSYFEKQVLVLYIQRYSYHEISHKINKDKHSGRINVKSVDNGLSRIKQKAREVYKRYG